MALQENEIFGVLGEEGFSRLVAAFYRQVPGDDILGPMYPKDELAAAEQRLRDFLIGRFGGPDRYVESRGHPRLRMRHAPFKINVPARHRWMENMEKALVEVGLPNDVEKLLRAYFSSTATFMINS